jgi:toxin YoeB
LRKHDRSLEFDPSGFEDLAWWIEKDRKKALRIVKLIEDVHRSPFEGAGQPERLKHQLSGCWSRRIDQEHRLVYPPFAKRDSHRSPLSERRAGGILAGSKSCPDLKLTALGPTPEARSRNSFELRRL